jgi:hypothetical protein
MFKREGDPKDYNYLYSIPTGLFIGGALAAQSVYGPQSIHSLAGLVSAASCISALAYALPLCPLMIETHLNVLLPNTGACRTKRRPDWVIPSARLVWPSAWRQH